MFRVDKTHIKREKLNKTAFKERKRSLQVGFEQRNLH